MKPIPLTCASDEPEIRVYDCEINLKFRLIEDKSVLSDRDRLLELLLDAFSYGADDCLETVRADVKVQEIPETETSPQMRRQLIRLRNACP